MYIQHQASKELGIDRKNILLYALCILYVLSIVTVVLDITKFIVFSKVSKIPLIIANFLFTIFG